ncbi:MAG: co-chaperone GroES [Alphaproteobacteria bacterium]|nr:co-chaperone GroES [Alphaproteobacteria bacterium]
MLKAVADRIIVKLDETAQSALIMPNVEFNTRNSGVVLSVGEKVTLVNPGDHVVFHLFDELPLPDEGVVVIREKSLLGVYAE